MGDIVKEILLASVTFDRSEFYIAAGVVVLLIIAGFFVVTRLRGKLNEARNSPDLGEHGLTLEQIDQMYEAGKISAEERISMRQVVLGQKPNTQRKYARDASPPVVAGGQKHTQAQKLCAPGIKTFKENSTVSGSQADIIKEPKAAKSQSAQLPAEDEGGL